MGSGSVKYSPEFKQQAVREVVDRPRPIADVAREFGLVEQTLRNWVAAYRRKVDPQKAKVVEEENRRIRKLEKEVRELQEQNRFLVKASACFARRVP